MDCKHDICVPCLYRAIQASDPNHLQQGHFSCAVCDRLVGVPDFIKYEARKPGGALDTVHPPLDHGELSKRLQEAGPLPKYCMDCNRAMVSEVQCYCMDCRAYMCPSCGEKRHQRTSESGSYRMLEHVVVRVQPNQHGNPVLITAAQPMVQEENRYIPNAEGSGLMDKPAGSSPGAYSSGGYTAGCYPGGWCGRRPGGVGRSGYCNIITEVTSKPTTSYSDYVCETHPDQPVQFTCMTCKSPCLCAFCCIGADSAHGKGHIVMDLATAWDRIEYEINGSEMAKRNAAKDELQRLSEVSGSVAVHMHQLIKLLLGAVDSSFKILDQELLRCRDTSISSVNATFAHLVDTLNAVIDDDYIKAIARPMYALPGVLRSRGITVVKSYSAWARSYEQLPSIQDSGTGEEQQGAQGTSFSALEKKARTFPPSLDELQLKSEWYEATLAEARWVHRWIDEVASMQLASAHRLRGMLKELLLSQQILRVEKPRVPPLSPRSNEVFETIDLIDQAKTIINPLANKDFFNIDPPRPPSMRRSEAHDKTEDKPTSITEAVRQAIAASPGSSSRSSSSPSSFYSEDTYRSLSEESFSASSSASLASEESLSSASSSSSYTSSSSSGSGSSSTSLSSASS